MTRVGFYFGATRLRSFKIVCLKMDDSFVHNENITNKFGNVIWTYLKSKVNELSVTDCTYYSIFEYLIATQVYYIIQIIFWADII